jgi:glycine oxidase
MAYTGRVVGEVVIVGGGVAGCATAYYLAKAGFKSIIVEPGDLAGHASGFAVGSLTPVDGHGIPGPLSSLSMESFRMHRGLPEELAEASGIDYEYRVASHITVALEESAIPQLEESFALYSAASAHGFEARRLDPDEARRLEPRLSPKVIQALYTKGALALDSYKFTLSLAEAAQSMGATVLQGTVRGLESAGGRINKVLSDGDEVSCDAVVLAMGPWARKAESWLDVYIPVDPLKGEILRIRPLGPPLEHDFFGGRSAMYTKPDGLVWCGTTEDWSGFDIRSLEATRNTIVQWADAVLPGVGQGELMLHTACLRPVTPDWLPIIGKLPGYENLVVVTGAGKKGILLGPGMGKAAADIIANGGTDLSVAELGPERFVQPSR